MVQINYYSFFKLLNFFLKNGKKSLVMKSAFYFFKHLKIYAKQQQTDFSILMNSGFDSIRPVLYFTKIRRGRKVFYLPQLVRAEREINISLYWFSKAVSRRKEKKLEERIFSEFLDILSNKGEVLSQKKNMYDLLITNRPFIYLLKYR